MIWDPKLHESDFELCFTFFVLSGQKHYGTSTIMVWGNRKQPRSSERLFTNSQPKLTFKKGELYPQFPRQEKPSDLASKHTLHIQQNCATVHFRKWESNSWSNYIHALSDISLWGQWIIQGRRGIDSNGRLEFEKLTWGLEGIELINPRTEGTTEWVINDYDDLQVIRVPMEKGPNLLSLRRAGKCLRRWAVWRSKELVLATLSGRLVFVARPGSVISSSSGFKSVWKLRNPFKHYLEFFSNVT